jgi:hypothetical protein
MTFILHSSQFIRGILLTNTIYMYIYTNDGVQIQSREEQKFDSSKI